MKFLHVVLQLSDILLDYEVLEPSEQLSVRLNVSIANLTEFIGLHI